MSSWINIAADSDFSLDNIPFGVFSSDGKPRAATRLGDNVIDLDALQKAGFFAGINLPDDIFSNSVLNDFIALGKPVTSATRKRIQELFAANNGELRDNESVRLNAIRKVEEVQMLMPVRVGDYTDFYSSKEHATNVGTMFRDPNNALLPNWLHIPVGYHGRASSIVVSGTPLHRPKGQTKADDADRPTFGPCRLLDFELEMAFIVGKGNEIGTSVSVENAEDHIFGMVVFNDWSARDIQKWEYVPLGPFLAKNFGSSISPWIITMEALEPFRVAGPKQEPAVLPYLEMQKNHSFDIHLQAAIETNSGVAKTVSNSNFKYMYWSMAQQLAHHTVNGCNMNVGDMCASGTISGPTPESYGSMLEITWRGSKPIAMPDGTERKFIQDGDSVVMSAYCEKDGKRVGFGEVRTKVLPAVE
ncbi:MAG: fumarylacetoacetase [Flavobacteriales bacterium]|nr:fumarylacetoacetase [Flavobacteriales bacterium]